MAGEMAGALDFKAMFAAIPAAAPPVALRTALTPIAGSAPGMENHGSHYSITFSPEQEERVAAWILTQLRREPGPVQIETGGIAFRVITREYWPHIIGLLLAGAVLAYLFGKKGGF
jgi:hypothetical protein